MGIHESSVNFENLIKDLADMYPLEVGTVVLVELVANSLDSKATEVAIDFNSQTNVLTVTDNGSGMTASDFDQYHDFAAGLKTRGMGIGFAGVGAKISFNIASRVITETCSDSFVGGSNWYLESKKKLIWEDICPTRLRGKGTRVEVMFRPEVVLPFSETTSIGVILRRHYLPLFDCKFLSLYKDLNFYSTDLQFVVNGQTMLAGDVAEDLKLTKFKEFYPTVKSKRIGYGFFGIAEKEYPMGDNLCGVLLCTHGKVIKADFFNQFPSEVGPRIIGVVEIPNFIHFLTSPKTDFIRRLNYKEFEKLYGPIRQEFRNWLNELGVQTLEITASDEALRLEREMRKLVDEIPELGEFFGFRAPKSVLGQQNGGSVIASSQEGAELTFPIGEGESLGGEAPLDVGDGPGEALVENQETGDLRARPISRTGRRGPKIAFDEKPDRIDLAWIDGNNVVINSGHPAYVKVSSNNLAKRLHCIHSIANAIQKFLFTGSAEDLLFSDRMMSVWGKK